MGLLHVHLEKADLSGRRSQDPFALVYLLNETTGLATFQIENNRTATFDKNIRPEFNHDFFFRVIFNHEDPKFLMMTIFR